MLNFQGTILFKIYFCILKQYVYMCFLFIKNEFCTYIVEAIFLGVLKGYTIFIL